MSQLMVDLECPRVAWQGAAFPCFDLGECVFKAQRIAELASAAAAAAARAAVPCAGARRGSDWCCPGDFNLWASLGHCHTYCMLLGYGMLVLATSACFMLKQQTVHT